MLLILLLQAVATPPAEAPAAAPVTLAAVPKCATAEAGDDIVVCGRGDEPYRLKPLPEHYGPPPPTDFGINLGGARANLHAAQEGTPDGRPDKRVMVTLKIPF